METLYSLNHTCEYIDFFGAHRSTCGPLLCLLGTRLTSDGLHGCIVCHDGNITFGSRGGLTQ